MYYIFPHQPPRPCFPFWASMIWRTSSASHQKWDNFAVVNVVWVKLNSLISTFVFLIYDILLSIALHVYIYIYIVYCIYIHHIILYYITLYYITLYYIILYYIILYNIHIHFDVLSVYLYLYHTVSPQPNLNIGYHQIPWFLIMFH